MSGLSRYEVSLSLRPETLLLPEMERWRIAGVAASSAMNALRAEVAAGSNGQERETAAARGHRRVMSI